jgi:hypothetical protein
VSCIVDDVIIAEKHTCPQCCKNEDYHFVSKLIGSLSYCGGNVYMRFRQIHCSAEAMTQLGSQQLLSHGF